MEQVYLAPSTIEGTGCFASKHLKKGELLGEYTGERISDAEASARYADTDRTYLFSVEGGCIDAQREDNPLKFINHSCEPNCESEEREGRIFISIIKDVRKDEELTMDYNLVVDERERGKYGCRCGAARCRGTMEASDGKYTDNLIKSS